ncbi:uncharacterized protein LOC100201352 isoform X4 [Hydra vulgaris]|uniref:Uncharacterized protein LOC100201352 isoform X4 n=1 Tax=Hydra vulgaris TaxID=6087 RepID=A0ABM4CN47_HYDVU
MSCENNLFFKRKVTDELLYRKGPSPISDEEQFSYLQTDKIVPLGLSESFLTHGEKEENAGSEVLIIYFAKLGHCSDESITVDLNYIKVLINNGADVNYADDFGQTVMHEAALRWPLEVAQFLFDHHANLNKTDNYGRTPLHVAASVNYSAMVKWLVENGANIHATTFNENQTPLHFASKYNSVNSIVRLLELGAKVDAQDYKERTPLYLAAETCCEEASRILLEHGAPAGVYDDSGMSCLSHLVAKMPNVAVEALDQFQHVDKANRTTKYYLSYLETKKWKNSRKLLKKSVRVVLIREPLEDIVKNQDSSLIMHPVIQRLVKKKTLLYGQHSFIFVLLINLLFTTIWTALTFTLPHHKFDISTDLKTAAPETILPNITESADLTFTKSYDSTLSLHSTISLDSTNTTASTIQSISQVEFYTPYDKQSWRFVLEFIGLLLAIYFFIQTKVQFKMATESYTGVKASRLQELSRDLNFCHPRWPQERKLIEEEIRNINIETMGSLYDAWIVFDMLCYIGLAFLMITRIILISSKEVDNTYETALRAHYYAFPVVLFIIWIRFMSSFRPFFAIGPFIAMFGSVAEETVKFAFLFMEFLIPYACTVWIIFGGPRWDDNSYTNFDDVMFQLLRITNRDSFSYTNLYTHNGTVNTSEKVVAQLICGSFYAFMSITCISLYIGILSQTFTRVFSNAAATAYMLQAEALIIAEKKLGKKKKREVQNAIANYCSPEASSLLYEKDKIIDDLSVRIQDLMTSSDA